jgi:hypothetical protein
MIAKETNFSRLPFHWSHWTVFLRLSNIFHKQWRQTLRVRVPNENFFENYCKQWKIKSYSSKYLRIATLVFTVVITIMCSVTELWLPREPKFDFLGFCVCKISTIILPSHIVFSICYTCTWIQSRPPELKTEMLVPSFKDFFNTSAVTRVNLEST